MSASRSQKHAYRIAEKKSAEKLSDAAAALADARGYAHIYVARLFLEQAIREFVLFAVTNPALQACAFTPPEAPTGAEGDRKEAAT